MEDRSSGVPREFEQVGVGAGRRPGPIFALDVRRERSGSRQATREPDAGDERLPVPRRREVVGLHRGRLERVDGLDANASP